MVAFVLEGQMMSYFKPAPPQRNPYIEAIDVLRRAGKTVTAADGIPGLVNVDGRELTMGQVMDLARQTVGTDPFADLVDILGGPGTVADFRPR